MKPIIATDNSKGEVIIPIWIKKALNIVPGSKVLISHREGMIIIEPRRDGLAIKIVKG